jgi:hypothetical protein
MEEKDIIKDLFKEKLSQLEVPVGPEVWTSISASIGAASVKTGLSLAAKLGLSVAAVTLAAGVYLILPSKEVAKKEVAPKSNSKEIKQSPIESNAPQLVEEKQGFVQNKQSLLSLFEAPIINTSSILDYYPLDILQDLSNNPSDNYQVAPIEPKVNNSLLEQVNPVNPSVSTGKIDQQIAPISEPNIAPIESSADKLELVNIFTPNGDGNNDYLSLPKSVDWTDFSIVVLNRENKIIYQSTESSFQWDGKQMNGSDAPSGQYLYFITAKSSEGKTIQQYSSLFIQR